MQMRGLEKFMECMYSEKLRIDFDKFMHQHTFAINSFSCKRFEELL